MRLNLSLRKGTTTIFFISPIKLSHNSKIKLNKAKMLWSLYNVGENEKIIIDSTNHEISQGYYSFDNLKEFLESKNCVIQLEKSGKCTITPESGKTLNLKNIGSLLGFNVNHSLNSKETSPNIVDVNGGLRTISIFCNRVNTFRNFDMGKRSEKITNILVPSGNLWGNTSEHFIENSTFLENGDISSIEFTLSDNCLLSDKDSYTMYLECEIV